MKSSRFTAGDYVLQYYFYFQNFDTIISMYFMAFEKNRILFFFIIIELKKKTVNYWKLKRNIDLFDVKKTIWSLKLGNSEEKG